MLTDITIISLGHRHLVCNGSTEAGWLTACGMRVMAGWPAQRMAIREIGCPACIEVVADNDY
jgi:hypothetical protein